jgi:hypothetical protein
MDLAANSHASAKSQRMNFSSSTGNSTNRSVNTKQFAIAHKSCALELAMERNKRLSWNMKTRIWPIAFKNLKQCSLPVTPVPSLPKSNLPPQPIVQYKLLVQSLLILL